MRKPPPAHRLCSCTICRIEISVQNLEQHLNVKHAGIPREQDKFSQLNMLREIPPEEIIETYVRLGSITKVLTHYGFKGHSGARAYISNLVKGITTARVRPIRSTDLEARRDEIFALLPTCPTRVAILQGLGITRVHAGLYNSLNQFLGNHNIVLTERTGKWTSDRVYVEDSKFSRNGLAVRVKRDGWMPYTCQKCSNDGRWQGESLTLHLDHINGINTDHRKENLRWLCPNCHSQTPTYCKGWKNKRA